MPNKENIDSEELNDEDEEEDEDKCEDVKEDVGEDEDEDEEDEEEEEGDEEEEGEDEEEGDEGESEELKEEYVSGPAEIKHDLKYKDDGKRNGKGRVQENENENSANTKENEGDNAKNKSEDETIDGENAEKLKGCAIKDDTEYKANVSDENIHQTTLWKAKPRPPPDPIEFPPQEKSLSEILKEERIPPIRRYAPKSCTKKILIPFVVPWEQTPAKQTQRGMGAFGKVRDPFLKIDQGGKQLKQGNVRSENELPLFEQLQHIASQKGVRSFGSHRAQIATVIDNHDFDTSKLHLSEGIVPKQTGGGSDNCFSQAGRTPIGGLRQQITVVKYSDKQTKNVDREGDGFISRQWAPNPNNRAGSGIIDRRRGVICLNQDESRQQQSGQGHVPLLFDTQDLEKLRSTGAGISGLGPFRQVGNNITSGKNAYCKKVIILVIQINL